MIRLDTAAFADFCGRLTLPSKDEGVVPLTLLGTQQYFLREVAAGLERGVHEFVCCKGRQLGISTIHDALDLWWPQANPGTQGMLVSDDDGNMQYRRDVILQMHAGLPKAYRYPVRVNNKGQLAWDINGSRLMFAAAGKRTGSNLGRSRGINYLHGDECGSWVDQQAVAALRAALSKRHPRRLYSWNSTARGFNVFWEMWRTAEKAVSQRAIFIGWWRHDGYRVEASERELWDRYGGPATGDERRWARVIRDRYEVTILPEQLVWYRWQLAEEFFGDETLLAQEYPCLPEDAFQAFGDKFIDVEQIRALRLTLREAPAPTTHRYEFAATLDDTKLLPAAPARATMTIWEEPVPEGVYVVAGHPWGSSDPKAELYVAQVWRVWPDRITQVAEYASDDGATYQFAWVCLDLAGHYRSRLIPAYFILEMGATGFAVLDELQRIERTGYGLAVSARRTEIQDIIGSIRHYFYRRPDNVFARTAPIEWHTHANNRPWIMHGLRDTIARGHAVIRSAALVDELAALRRGEEGDNDQIEGGGVIGDSRAMCAALAVHCWLHEAMADLQDYVAPVTPAPSQATTVEQSMVQTYLARVMGR